jgi:hypothetical protein
MCPYVDERKWKSLELIVFDIERTRMWRTRLRIYFIMMVNDRQSVLISHHMKLIYNLLTCSSFEYVLFMCHDIMCVNSIDSTHFHSNRRTYVEQRHRKSSTVIRQMMWLINFRQESERKWQTGEKRKYWSCLPVSISNEFKIDSYRFTMLVCTKHRGTIIGVVSTMDFLTQLRWMIDAKKNENIHTVLKIYTYVANNRTLKSQCRIDE